MTPEEQAQRLLRAWRRLAEGDPSPPQPTLDAAFGMYALLRIAIIFTGQLGDAA